MSDTADFFRGRIDQIIDLKHPQAVLGARMPWRQIEASLAGQFARRSREGKRLWGIDLCSARACSSLARASRRRAARAWRCG
jgi:IS5 family transposase